MTSKQVEIELLQELCDENVLELVSNGAVSSELAKELIEEYEHTYIEEEVPERLYIPPEKYDSIFENTSIPDGVELRNYQKEAVYCWRNNGYRGVFNMATGTGKTITALLAMRNLYAHCKERLGVVILCPYKHLVNQWLQDLIRFGIHPVVGYSGRNRENFSRYLESSIRLYNKGEKKTFVFITTNNTFRSYDIQYFLKEVKENLLLIADEAHSLGSTENLKYLTDIFDYRLALSATFERYWDADGSKKLRHFFDKDVFVYGLKEAIKEKFLVPYEYHPVVCHLSDLEYDCYLELSLDLKNHLFYENGEAELSELGKLILIQRARVVAAAADKIAKLDDIIKQYEEDNGMLVYCGSANMFESEERQIDYVTNLLKRKHGISVDKFTCEESMDDRKRLLQGLTNQSIQALTAIRCLDEGVNIPNVRTAFILASANNPKEYVQRRGRVLRCAPGKEKAVIYDFVTLPYRENKNPEEALISGSKYDLSLVMREVKRMQEFGKIAINKKEVFQKVVKIKKLFGMEEEHE